MADNKIIMFQNRLAKVSRHLGKQAKRRDISCYRVYDHDLPEFPFCIEYYGDKLYVAEYKRRHGMSEEEHDDWVAECLKVIAEVLDVSIDDIFLRLRQRKPGRLGQYQKMDGQKNEFVVTENGLRFIVNLTDYLDTGLFLDHRITREMVRAEVKGKKFLNLFAYTGSFSVYAAAGEADEVVTVDLSNTYLKWAERNMKENGFNDEKKYRFVQADVLQYLVELPSGYFDVIVLDPPTFSNSKRMDEFLDVQRDHVSMINNCLEVLKPGGKIYFSTNFTKFILNKESINSNSIKDITRATTSFDFEGRFSRYCYLITKD